MASDTYRRCTHNRLTSALKKSIPSYNFMTPEDLDEFITRRRSSELSAKNMGSTEDYKDSAVIDCYEGFADKLHKYVKALHSYKYKTVTTIGLPNRIYIKTLNLCFTLGFSHRVEVNLVLTP